MIINNFDDSLRKGYHSPTAEEIMLETGRSFLLNGSQLPEYPEDTVYHEDF